MDDSAPPALPALPPPTTSRGALLKTGRQLRYGAALLPWMQAYAEWLILECLGDFPKITLRATRARALARAPVIISHIALLEARPDFLAYCDELRKGPLERARAKFASRFPSYIDAHHEALTEARRVGDYGAMAKIAEPVLDRVYPKKTDVAQATQVNIVLTPQQMQSIAAYTPAAVDVTEREPEASDIRDDSN